MAEHRITTDDGTNLTIHMELISQNVETNTSTVRMSMSGRIMLGTVTIPFPPESETP